jgi:hypothetical protein
MNSLKSYRWQPVACVLLFLLSCKSHSKNDNPVVDKQSALSDITRADQFSSQRDDLKQLQQGIVLLREAMAADPSNYDAAWRLAKFDYYLATHTDGDY